MRAFDTARKIVVPELNLGQYIQEVQRLAFEWAQSAGKVRYEVTPRPARSFQVDALGVTVTVIGTVFDVTVERGKVTVMVERGRVRVAHGDRTVELAKGERIAIDAQAEAHSEPAAQGPVRAIA